MPHLLYPFLCWWTFRLLPCLGFYTAAMNTGVHVSFWISFLWVYNISLCDRTRTETAMSFLLSETSCCQDTSKVSNYVLQISSIFANEEGSCIQFEGGIYNPSIDWCSPLLSEVSGYGKKPARLHWHDSLCDELNTKDRISGHTRNFFVLSLILSPRM